MVTDASGNIHDRSVKFAGHDRSAPESVLGAHEGSEQRAAYRQALTEYWDKQVPRMLEARSRAQDAQIDLAWAEVLMLNPNVVEMRYAWRDDERLGFPDEVCDADGEPIEIDLDTQLDLFDDYDEARSRFLLDDHGRFIITIAR